MGTKTRLDICLDDKKRIETLVDFAANIPDNELHVLEGTDISTKLKGIGSVSLALSAEANPKFGNPGYVIGYLKSLKVKHVDRQSQPLAINAQQLATRETEEFRRNDCYSAYQVSIISPSTDVWDFLHSGKNLAPWAVPDRPYVPQS